MYFLPQPMSSWDDLAPVPMPSPLAPFAPHPPLPWDAELPCPRCYTEHELHQQPDHGILASWPEGVPVPSLLTISWDQHVWGLLSRSPSLLHKPTILLPGWRRRPPLSGVQGQLEMGFESQGFVHHLWGLQDVPLGEGPAWVGQHVRPVPQLVACGSAAQEEFANGLILGHFVMIPDGDDHVYILGGYKKEGHWEGVCCTGDLLSPGHFRETHLDLTERHLENKHLIEVRA